MVKPWDQLPRELTESSPFQVFEIGNRHSSEQPGLFDLLFHGVRLDWMISRGIFQLQLSCNFMVLWNSQLSVPRIQHHWKHSWTICCFMETSEPFFISLFSTTRIFLPASPPINFWLGFCLVPQFRDGFTFSILPAALRGALRRL